MACPKPECQEAHKQYKREINNASRHRREKKRKGQGLPPRMRNKAKDNASHREWKKRNKAKVNASNRKYRAAHNPPVLCRAPIDIDNPDKGVCGKPCSNRRSHACSLKCRRKLKVFIQRRANKTFYQNHREEILASKKEDGEARNRDARKRYQLKKGTLQGRPCQGPDCSEIYYSRLPAQKFCSEHCRKNYQKANPEKFSYPAQRRKWRAANRAKVNAQRRNRRAANRERLNADRRAKRKRKREENGTAALA
jgi:hypothetical protein